MATTQQPVSVTVYGGGGYAQPAQPTVIQAVHQTAVPVPVRPNTLPHRNSHKILGIIQMTVGCFCFLLSIIGFIEGGGGSYSFFGSGIYSGIFFTIPGVLGFMAYQQNSKCLVVSCMVMNIIAACVSTIGLSFASIELAVNRSTGFQRAKCGIIIFCCIFELIVTIVHAGFTCASCCDCCLPREAVAMPASVGVTGPVVIHQVPQSNVTYPAQPYQYHLPQQQATVMHIPANPQPGYPQQAYPTQSYPQQQPQFMPPPAYNPNYENNAPPAYSDIPPNK